MHGWSHISPTTTPSSSFANWSGSELLATVQTGKVELSCFQFGAPASECDQSPVCVCVLTYTVCLHRS